MRTTMRIAAVLGAAAVALSALTSGQAQSGRAPPAGGGFELVEASMVDLENAYTAGTLTVHAVVQAYLDRIAAFDRSGPTINSIITVNDHALDDADVLDRVFKKSGPVGPLHGIPV